MDKDTSRLAKNTIILYFRQILIMLVSLYTVRVVLHILGEEDYGIKNVVSGVVSMFGFLNGALSTATQRFFTVDIGKNDEEHLKTTFSIAFQIYLSLAIIIFLLSETIGLWFVNNKLVIPAERLTAANWIYQASIFSFFLSLITNPYTACLIAHENMNIYAYVSIIEVFLKLFIVYLLQLLKFDKLIVYGLLLSGVSFIRTGIYRFYCKRRYPECHFHFVKDIQYFKEQFYYAGWNFLGSFASILKNQGTTILLNLFFGPIVNAARAIASQVSNTMLTFTSNFSIALRPQIIKKYSNNEKESSYNLVYKGSKLCFFLFLLPSIPILLNTNYILVLWLKKIPDNTVLFTRLIILDCLVDCMRLPLLALMHAQGNMRTYQLSVSGFLLLNIPLSYLLLKIGMPAASVMILAIILSFISLCVRVIVLNKLAGLYIRKYFINVLLICFIVFIIALIPLIIWFKWKCNTFFIFIIQSIICIIWTLCVIFLLGLNGNERKEIYYIVSQKLKGIKK